MTNRVTVLAIDKKFETLKNPVRKQALDILAVLKKDGVAIDILLLGSRKMRALNKRCRGKDYPTNVLSFEEPKQFVYPDQALSLSKGKGLRRKGEIYLNPEMASDWWLKKATKGSPACPEASRGERSRRAEEYLSMQFLLVHGILHLFGYDHINDGDAQKMERKEVALMKLLKK